MYIILCVRSNYCFIEGCGQTISFIYVIFVRIIQRTWLNLVAAILHCYETFMLAYIVTPKYFSFTVLLRIVPPMS